MSTAALQGDPRRPGALHPFVRAAVSEDDRPADYYALLAIVLGLTAFSSRVRAPCADATQLGNFLTM
jgi:hypothetical protein